MVKMAKPGIFRRFSAKNSRGKIRAETAGQPDSRQQAPPAKPPGKARRKLRRERERSPGEYARSRTGTNGRNYAGRRRRLAEWPRRGVLCARYQVYTRSIYDPPIVPPSPMQEPNAIPAKSTASTTSTSRQPTQHRHTSHTGTASTEGKAHSTAQPAPADSPAHTTPPQPAPAHTTASQHYTRPGRSERRRRRPAQRPPPARPGGRRYSRRGL